MLSKSIKFLKDNKVIIFPAETLYGFSCSFYSLEAINRVFKIKKRENEKQFIVLIKSFKMAKEIVEIDPIKEDFLLKNNYWPNHLTIVFKSKIKGYNTLALRFSNSKYISKLFKSIDFPIISTSVNYSSEPSYTDIDKIIEEFNNKVDYINTTSPESIGKASTIIDFTTDEPSLIREGDVPYNKIKEDYAKFARNYNK
jgi:L-threonylcarbamoyladenylate synthase